MLNFPSLVFKIQLPLISLGITLPNFENAISRFGFFITQVQSSLFEQEILRFFGMLMFRFSVAFMLFVLVSTVLWIYYCLYLFRALLCSDGYWTSSLLR